MRAGRSDAEIDDARLEAVRAFAYGAGHEINNPLANIAARAQALLVDEDDPERRRKLATIVDQAFRARDMIGGLMVFARPPAPRPKVVGLHETIRPAVEAVRSLADARHVRLEYSPPPAPVAIEVDAAQVGEAIRALLQNAVEAVDDGGQVVVEAIGHADGSKGGLTVTDDGPGMDADAMRAAFDPFFSGRDAGRGIGLGLPKARRLVEINGGSLSLGPRPGGRGVRVAIELPAERRQPSPPGQTAGS